MELLLSRGQDETQSQTCPALLQKPILAASIRAYDVKSALDSLLRHISLHLPPQHETTITLDVCESMKWSSKTLAVCREFCCNVHKFLCQLAYVLPKVTVPVRVAAKQLNIPTFDLGWNLTMVTTLADTQTCTRNNTWKFCRFEVLVKTVKFVSLAFKMKVNKFMIRLMFGRIMFLINLQTTSEITSLRSTRRKQYGNIVKLPKFDDEIKGTSLKDIDELMKNWLANFFR